MSMIAAYLQVESSLANPKPNVCFTIAVARYLENARLFLPTPCTLSCAGHLSPVLLEASSQYTFASLYKSRINLKPSSEERPTFI